MAKAKQKKIATVRNPSVEAVVKQLLRLPDEATALRKIEQMRGHFVVSKQNIEESDTPHLMMWIKGFDVSDEELKKGFLGHFAIIAPKKLPDDRWTLTPTKVELELGKHPQKKYQAKKQRHPNWGHPILRKIKKGIDGVDLEDAVAYLMKLHEEYPEASIPGDMKLYLMIYAKAEKGDRPIKKYVFEVVQKEIGYSVVYEENTYQAEQEAKAPKAPELDKEVLGRFTAKAIMKKKRK